MSAPGKAGSPGWAEQFAAELMRLGVQPARASDLCTETVGQAGEAGTTPEAVFGPAHLYARHLVRELHRARPVPEPRPSQAGRVLISLRGVGKRYRRRTVLSGVDLTVRTGEVVAVVGANGCGKSTLLKICAGLVRPSTGTVRRVRRIGYVPQDGGTLDWLSAAEHFALFGAAAGMGLRRAISTGEHLGTRLSWRPPAGQLAMHLSGGNRQKLNLVLGELHAPDLLLLDEPYQGFDEGTYLDFWQQVFSWRNAGRGVIVVTHMLHDLQNVDQVLDLGEGVR